MINDGRVPMKAMILAVVRAVFVHQLAFSFLIVFLIDLVC